MYPGRGRDEEGTGGVPLLPRGALPLFGWVFMGSLSGRAFRAFFGARAEVGEWPSALLPDGWGLLESQVSSFGRFSRGREASLAASFRQVSFFPAAAPGTKVFLEPDRPRCCGRVLFSLSCLFRSARRPLD